MGTFNCPCKVLWCSTGEPMVDCKHHSPCNVLLHMFIVVYIHIVCCSCFHRQQLYPPYYAIVTSCCQCDVHVVSTYKPTTTTTLLFSSVMLVNACNITALTCLCSDNMAADQRLFQHIYAHCVTGVTGCPWTPCRHL